MYRIVRVATAELRLYALGAGWSRAWNIFAPKAASTVQSRSRRRPLRFTAQLPRALDNAQNYNSEKRQRHANIKGLLPPSAGSTGHLASHEVGRLHIFSMATKSAYR